MSIILPDFIIGGERRCGTTSLLKNLSQHPEIFGHPKQDKSWFIEDSVRKKPDYSRWEDKHNITEYSAWFAAENPPVGSVIGEKSADYLFWRNCHKRLGKHLPDTKFIFILRNPIKRAWSHYWNEIAKGREKLTFTEAILKEAERLKIDDYHLYNFSYKSRGFYSDSLSHFFNHVEKERCLVLPVEYIWQNPQKELRRICAFLGVDKTYEFPSKETAFNANWAVFPKPWAREGVMRFFADNYASIADTYAKLRYRDRSIRREKLMKFKAPFFDPAKEMAIPQDIENYLKTEFKKDTKKLATLIEQDFSVWE